jgi:hypothetical protein
VLHDRVAPILLRVFEDVSETGVLSTVMNSAYVVDDDCRTVSKPRRFVKLTTSA